MEITHFKITGWDSAIRSMYMTKKTYNDELEGKLSSAEVCINKKDAGIRLSDSELELVKWYNGEIVKVIKIGSVHYNLLKHVDFTCTVVGLHRGGQDDLDAHAERFDTRFIRMTTRGRNNLELSEISDFYKGKILTFGDLDTKFKFPDAIVFEDNIFKKTPLGYIREDCMDDNDVRRGLVLLATSSTFTFKCDLAEFCHVYRERNKDSAATPELKDLIEMIADLITWHCPEIDRDYLLNKCIQ